jgi:transposase InsO family protein
MTAIAEHDSRTLLVILKDDTTSFPAWYQSTYGHLVKRGASSCLRSNYTILTSETLASLPSTEYNAYQSEWGIREKALALILETLGQEVKTRIPPQFVDYREPDPRGLMNHLEYQFGAQTASRQAELLTVAWNTRTPDGGDVLKNFGLVTGAMNEIAAALPHAITAKQYISTLHCHALLLSLPPSYSTFTSSIYHGNFTIEQITQKVSSEVRRRAGEEENAALHMARTGSGPAPGRIQKVGKDGNRLWGPNENEFCTFHHGFGHSNAECYRQGAPKPTGNRPLPRVPVASAPARPAAYLAEQQIYDGPAEMFLSMSISSAPSVTTEAYLASTTTTDLNKFIVDSGTTDHMCGNLDLMEKVHKLASPIVIRVGNGGEIFGTHIGELKIARIHLTGVLHVPGIYRHLLCVRKIASRPRSIYWTMDEKEAVLVGPKGSLLTAPIESGLYTYTDRVVRPPPLALISLAHAHRSLGHLNVADVLRLGKEGRLGEWDNANVSITNFKCHECQLGKGRRLTTHESKDRGVQPLGTIHADVWGPSPVPSISGHRYFLTVYDDYTRKISLTFMKHKSEVITKFKEYVCLVENQLNLKVKILRCDNGGEFTSNAFAMYLKEKGIEQHFTPPGSHGQNGRVERVHLTILNTVRTLLLDTGLPHTFWAEAANYACYTRNRSPCGPNHLIPDDLWYGKRVQLTHLRPFGAPALWRIHAVLNKLQPRYSQGFLIGYRAGTTSYKIWDISTHKAVWSRDVVFTDASRNIHLEPPIPFAAGEEQLEENDGESLVNYPNSGADGGDNNGGDNNGGDNNGGDNNDDNSGDDCSVADELLVDIPVVNNEPEVNGQPQNQPAVQPGDAPRRTERVRNPPQAWNRGFAQYANIATTIPKSYNDARNSADWPAWLLAMQTELGKMEDYDVWDVVTRKEGTRTLKGRWVFDRKIDATTGAQTEYKARWVAKGYSQVEGLDYSDLFASVAHKDSIRVFLATVNHLDLECDQIDIKSAFLNGDLLETLYMEPPEGSDIPAGSILLLKKSIYGLKQASRCFRDKYHEQLSSMGFVASIADNCIYTRRRGTSFLMLSLHVDDSLVAGNDRAELDQFKIMLNGIFEMKDCGEAKYFLGFNIHRDRPNRKLWISQKHYLNEVLRRFGMENSNPAILPFPSGFQPKIASDDEWAAAKHLDFPAIAGAVQYAATISRPDLSFAANVLCRFMSRWSCEHYAAAKHLLRYIRGTVDQCLVWHADTGCLIEGYADADWGGCLETRRSTTGYGFRFAGGLVAWRSRRQPTVAMSTSEAEYMASCEAARQARWLKQLLSDIGLFKEGPIPIFNDNVGAIQLSKNPVQHDRSKHIDMRHHYLRENVLNQQITLDYVPTQDNFADTLTKGLPKEPFLKFRKILGLWSSEELAKGGC